MDAAQSYTKRAAKRYGTRTGWLRDPKLAREGETIGGGFIVHRRGDGTGRIRPAYWPFEYATEAEAREQAEVLANRCPGYRFQVWAVTHTAYVEPTQPESEAA